MPNAQLIKDVALGRTNRDAVGGYDNMMKHLSSALILIGMVAQGSTQHFSRLDDMLNGEIHAVSPRVLDRCELGTALDQLARKAHVLVGFEQTADCWLSGRRLNAEPDSETLSGLTIRQALDAQVAVMPGYSWRPMNDVIVVRPRVAWDDPNH